MSVRLYIYIYCTIEEYPDKSMIYYIYYKIMKNLITFVIIHFREPIDDGYEYNNQTKVFFLFFENCVLRELRNSEILTKFFIVHFL